jgi:hypothetical protein
MCSTTSSPRDRQTRDKQDAEPELKEPTEGKQATKQPVRKAAAYPKLAPHFVP